MKWPSGLLPEVPTLVEAGAAAMPFTPWAGLFGPARMPRPVVERLARELNRALAQPEVREQFGKLAFEVQSSTPEELSEMVRDQLAVWRKAGKEAGLAAE